MCEAKARTEGISVEEARAELIPETLFKRSGEPGSGVEELVAFLASSRATLMTGSCTEVDGGLVRVT